MEDHGGSKKLLLSYSAQFGLRASWASGRLHARLRYGEPTYAQETSPMVLPLVPFTKKSYFSHAKLRAWLKDVFSLRCS